MRRFPLLMVFAVTACIVSSHAATSVGSPVTGKESAPDIASLMNILQGKFSLKDLFGMGSLLRTGFQELEKIVNFSPLLQEMLQQAAKTNPSVKVVNTMLNGKTPGLADVFKMVTTKSDSIIKSFNKMEHHNPKWLQMEAIMQSNKYNNHANLRKILEILAGRKIDENVVKLKNDKYTVSELSDLAYQNVLKLAYFFGDNYVRTKEAMHLLNHEPIDFQGVLRLLTKFDISNFPTTMVTDVNKNPSTNPDSVHFLNGIKLKYPQILAEHDNKKASAAIYDALNSLLKITDEVITEVETLDNGQANNAKP